MSTEANAFNYDELIKKIIQTNAIAEDGETLISLLETAGILAAKRNPIRTNIAVYNAPVLGYPENNTSLGSLYHYLEFNELIIPGSTVRDTAATDNHFKFIAGRSGRYRISVNFKVAFLPVVDPPRTAGEAAQLYFTSGGQTDLQISIFKNGAPGLQKFYGPIRAYSTTNEVYNYFDVCACCGSAVYDVTAGDVLEPVANLLNVGLPAVSYMTLYGDISINWIDNHKLIT